MSEPDDPEKPAGFAEAAHEADTDHAYEMWVRRKIERALKHSLENPDSHVSQEEVWRMFGLER